MRETYQLSLLGDQPKKGREWKPVLYCWTFFGVPIERSPAALRQSEMLTQETRDTAQFAVPQPSEEPR